MGSTNQPWFAGLTVSHPTAYKGPSSRGPSMQSVKNVVPFVLLVGCAPQSAVLESGSYIAFFSEGTSLSLAKGEVDEEEECKKYTPV